MSMTDDKIEVTFAHPQTSNSYLADVNLLITAEQILAILHAENTGPFLQPLPEKQYELLILRRTKTSIEIKSSIGEAGIKNGDVLDIVWTGNKDNSSLKTDNNILADPPLLIGKAQRVHDAFPKLSNPQQYIEDVKKHIASYTKRSDHCKHLHDIIQYVTIFGAASVSLSLFFSESFRWIPAIISFIIAVATGVDKINSYSKEHHMHFRCHYLMSQELNKYSYELGRYRGKAPSEAFEVFVEHIQELEDELHNIRGPNEENNGNLVLTG